MITLWLNQPKYCKYMSDTGSFHSNPRKLPNASFLYTVGLQRTGKMQDITITNFF